jgi:hypothetical protein
MIRTWKCELLLKLGRKWHSSLGPFLSSHHFVQHQLCHFGSHSNT